MFNSLSQDPRSRQGQLARGANIYMGASKSPYAGTPTEAGADRMRQAPLMPRFRRQSLADVARAFLSGNSNR